MHFRPPKNDVLLSPWHAALVKSRWIDCKQRGIIGKVCVEMRVMSIIEVHANDDAMKSSHFGHFVSLHLWRLRTTCYPRLYHAEAVEN